MRWLSKYYFWIFKNNDWEYSSQLINNKLIEEYKHPKGFKIIKTTLL